jgi:hypothetical protein
LVAAALTALSLAVALAAAEVVTRLASRDITTTADNRSYFAARCREPHAAEIDAEARGWAVGVSG